MRIATKTDKEKVIDILSKTFENNPGVNWTVSRGGDHKKKINCLMTYAFTKAFSRNGVYLSSNEMGVALCYKYSYRKMSFPELLYGLKLALTVTGLRRINKVLEREAYRASIRPGSGEYLYFWFLGVLPEGSGAGFELLHGILNQALLENLPVYLETTLEKNQKIYERVGFTTYHFWKDESADICFWFMKWEPESRKANGSGIVC